MEMRGMSGELLGHIGPPGISSLNDHSPSEGERKKKESRSSDTNYATPSLPGPALHTTAAPPKFKANNEKPLSSAFISKKRKILANLDPGGGGGGGVKATATDKSPKGSVDTQIRELIDEINAYPGLVTTSSCAGRVSVFLEGCGGGRKARKGTWTETEGNSSMQEEGLDVIDNEAGDRGQGKKEGESIGTTMTAQRQNGYSEKPNIGPKYTTTTTTITTSGKGLGGKWLFVSHDPPQLSSTVTSTTVFPTATTNTTTTTTTTTTSSDSSTTSHNTWTSAFGLHPPSPSPSCLDSSPVLNTSSRPPAPPPRFITLSFEPLILHIHCASLQHASRVLSAAQSAGFRESGIPSLRINDDVDDYGGEDSGAGVAVAVRSVGVGFKSVIGIYDDDEDGDGDTGDAGKEEEEMHDKDDDHGKLQAIVDESHLELLMRVITERFRANEARKQRFTLELRRVMMDHDEKAVRRTDEHDNESSFSHGKRTARRGRKSGGDWEDREVRAQRKRAEGLKRRDELEAQDR